ncbi:MAG: C1 family peptidase [Chloroflexota bacterium]
MDSHSTHSQTQLSELIPFTTYILYKALFLVIVISAVGINTVVYAAHANDNMANASTDVVESNVIEQDFIEQDIIEQDFSCQTVDEIPPPECIILTRFYSITGGLDWSNNTGWLQTNTPCTWYGIGCAGRHVVSIDLEANNLSNKLPNDLGGLRDLHTLIVSKNQLRENIPPELANLSNLTTLDLSYNSIVPREHPGQALADILSPDWRSTQTIAPRRLKARAIATDTVVLRWQPILYQDDGGYYEIGIAEKSGPATRMARTTFVLDPDSFTVVGSTADKTTTAYTVTGLLEDTTYFFGVRSFTPAHDNQPNDLYSDYGNFVATTTWPPVGCDGGPLDATFNPDNTQKEVCVDLDNHQSTVRLRSGEFLTIRLPVIPSNGFFWNLVTDNQGEDDAGAPVLLPLESIGIIEEDRTDPSMGELVTEVYRIDPIKRGRATVQLVYSDVEGNIEDTFVIHVETEGSFDDARPPKPRPQDDSRPPTVDPNTFNGGGGLVAASTQPAATSQNYPDAFSWCDHPDGNDYCTPVRNQGLCGNGWAFATVGVAESMIKYKDGNERDLSEQYLVSCNNGDDFFTTLWSCSGGWYAFDYFVDTPAYPHDTGPGTVLESDFPYEGEDSACLEDLTHYETLNSWSYVNSSDPFSVAYVDDIKQAIYDYGPVATSICIGVDAYFYTGGVFEKDESRFCPSSSANPTNHAVVIVGWDDVEGVWIMRNSWDTHWGEDGYMRIKYGTSNIGFAAAYAVYSGSTGSDTDDNTDNDGSSDAFIVQSNPNLLTATPVINDSGADGDQYQIDLSWSDYINDELGFNIYRREKNNDNSTWQVIATLAANSTSYSDTADASGLACNVSYSYRVTANNEDGESDYSNTVHTLVECTNLPSPTNFEAETGETGINLAWALPSSTARAALSIDGVYIGRWDQDAEEWVLIHTAEATTTSYTDNSLLDPGKTYYYILQSFDGDSVSAASDQQFATAPDVAINAPTSLSATIISNGNIALTWEDNSDNEAFFVILRYNDENNTWQSAGTVDSSVTTYTDSGLSCDLGEQHYLVIALNGSDQSAFSNQASSLPCQVETTPVQTVTSTPVPTSVPAATSTSVPTLAPVATSTSTSTATSTSMPTATPTAMPTGTPTGAPILTNTPTSTVAVSPTPTSSPTAISTATPTPTSSPASSPTSSPASTATPVPVTATTGEDDIYLPIVTQ